METVDNPRQLNTRSHQSGTPTSSAPAYRWPGEPMPTCRTGHIAFGPARYPTLAEVIELLPQYETTLWEHLRMDLAAGKDIAR